MGNNHLNHYKRLNKSQDLQLRIRRKTEKEGQVSEDFQMFCLKDGILTVLNEQVKLEYPESDVKYYQVDPIQMEIVLALNNSRKWTLTLDDLNDFLTWKSFLALSMRPEVKNSSKCLKCSKNFYFRRSFHCHFCGEQFCSECCRFLTLLNFLGYIKEKRICEDCISPINRIKTEESESVIKRTDSDSFMRSDSLLSSK
jgi:hypothetical protein